MNALLAEIEGPVPVIHKERAMQNIRAMREKAKRNGIQFRPHFKTHRSAEVGEWFRELGVTAITVSSLEMAEYFADHGWKDITVAIPVNLRSHKRISALAGRVKLQVLVESPEVVMRLNDLLTAPVTVFVKIDAGYNRTGIWYENFEKIEGILEAIRSGSKLTAGGFLIHSGHSYKCRSHTEILRIHEECKTRVLALKAHFNDPSLEVSVGDTPTCSIAEDFSWANEIRPGNFVYYDLMMTQITACGEDQIAAAMAAPIIARHPERGQLVVHAGGIHLSKDRLVDADGTVSYGKVVEFTGDGWSRIVEGGNVVSLSQEHGLIAAPTEFIERMQVGTLLGILPVHSCMMDMGEILPLPRPLS